MRMNGKGYGDHNKTSRYSCKGREDRSYHHGRHHKEDLRKEGYREWLLEKKKHLEDKLNEIEAELTDA